MASSPGSHPQSARKSKASCRAEIASATNVAQREYMARAPRLCDALAQADEAWVVIFRVLTRRRRRVTGRQYVCTFMMGAMGTTRSREYGVRVQDMPLLQGRVPERALDAYRTAARESGVSMSYYLEALAAVFEDKGGLPLVPKPVAAPQPLEFDVEVRSDTAAA